jgi:hypothetical protein
MLKLNTNPTSVYQLYGQQTAQLGYPPGAIQEQGVTVPPAEGYLTVSQAGFTWSLSA